MRKNGVLRVMLANGLALVTTLVCSHYSARWTDEWNSQRTALQARPQPGSLFRQSTAAPTENLIGMALALFVNVVADVFGRVHTWMRRVYTCVRDR